MLNNKLQAYRDLLKTAELHKEALQDDVNFSVKHLTSLVQLGTLEEMFGIPLYENYPFSYLVGDSYSNWTTLTFFDNENHHISWSDSGEQPINEWLYCIGFPTGAYIFGDSYPTSTFDKFFNELKSYGAKYCDTRNHCLYFTEENSKTVHENFWDIYKKYKALVVSELKELRKLELQAELDKLNKE